MKVIRNFNQVNHDNPVKIIITDLSLDEMRNIKVSDCRSNCIVTGNDKAIMIKNGRWYKIQTVTLEN